MYDGFKSKLSENDRLEISGEVEIKSENSSTKNLFRKKIYVQDFDLDKNTSALSSDENLVIIIPKKVSNISEKNNFFSKENKDF